MTYDFSKKKHLLGSSRCFCALGRIRTLNLLIRSQVLYPVELRMHFVFIRSGCKGGYFKENVQVYLKKSEIAQPIFSRSAPHIKMGWILRY